MSDPRRRTKIVASIGPASRDVRVLARLLEAGMDVARINLSHGTRSEHTATIETLRQLGRETQRHVAILIDLPGPKLRVGALSRPLEVREGEHVRLGPSTGLPVNFPGLLRHFRKGELVLVDDGAVAFRVRAVAPGAVELEALHSGVVEARKGVNLPDTHLPVGAITPTDRELLEWGLQEDVDYVGLSFARTAEDVRELKELIAASGGDQLIVAKIEKKEALAEHEAIIDEADAVMVARGDLGVEVDPAIVPVWQKRLIHAAHAAGKPVIIATQMLQSMITEPRPTRAEASDVANAIYDSTSDVMLSGETAIGAHPVDALKTMVDIALAVEADIDAGHRRPQSEASPSTGVSAAISYGACEVARRVGAAAIVTATSTGATARNVARNFPAQPIVAISPDQRVVNQLNLCWGVQPLLGERWSTLEDVVREADDLVLKGGWGRPGEVVVITAGLQTDQAGRTDLIEAHVLE